MMKVKFVALLTILCIVLPSFAACGQTNRDFPVLSYPESTDITDETTAEIIVDDEFVPEALTEITVALPYSDETVMRLFKLYYAKENGLFPEDQTGNDISIDYLDAIEIPWIVDCYLTSGQGAGISTALSWESQGALPDLMLVDSVENFMDEGLISPLNSNLNDNNLISAGNININAFSSVNYDGDIYGVPHYMSVYLLYGNKDFCPEDSMLSFRPSYYEFSGYLNSIKNSNDSDDLVVFAKAYEMMPYLTTTFCSDIPSSYMFRDEYELGTYHDYQLNNLLSFVSGLYNTGIAADYDINGADPRISRNAAMWFASSSEITLWNSYYPDSLYFSLLPMNDSEENAVLYSDVYSLCVSKDSEFQDFCAEFAAFISLDADALQLIWRLETPCGYFPVINNSSVWNLVYSEPLFGTEAIVIEQFIDDAIICPSPNSAEAVSVEEYNDSYFSDVDLEQADSEYNILEEIYG